MLLLLGSVAAFTWTEKLKLERPPVSAAGFAREFSPVCGCRRETARLTLVLRSAERIDVSVVNSDGQVVSILAESLERPSGRVRLEWDGRDESGRLVPDGPYRVRVHLERDGRTVLMRQRVRVDTKAPRVRLRGVSGTTVSRGGAGVELRYVASEAGRPILLVNGKNALRGPVEEAGPATLTWDGSIRSRTAAPGVYDVALVLVDQAGNRSAPSTAVALVVS